MQEYEYYCTGCNRPTKRDLLTAKKVLFNEIGKGGRTLRSRTVDWLCPDCVKQDPAWLLEPNQAPTQRESEINGRQALVPARTSEK